MHECVVTDRFQLVIMHEQRVLLQEERGIISRLSHYQSQRAGSCDTLSSWISFIFSSLVAANCGSWSLPCVVRVKFCTNYPALVSLQIHTCLAGPIWDVRLSELMRAELRGFPCTMMEKWEKRHTDCHPQSIYRDVQILFPLPPAFSSAEACFCLWHHH